MKLQKLKQLITIGTAVSLALLVGMGTANAAGKSNSPNRNTSGEPEKYGASVGVSSTCALDGTKFQVTTTITDKSSGDDIFPIYGAADVNYFGKKRGKKIIGVSPYLISGPIPFVATTSVVTHPPLDLCDARANDSLKDGTVSLNSFTSVTVANSKGGASYDSYCVATDESPKVVIDVGILDDNCPK